MPLQFIGASAPVTSNGAAPGAITPHASTAQGDLLIFFHYSSGTGGNETVTPGGTGWNLIKSNVSATGGLIAAYWRTAQAGDTTFTATVTNHSSGSTGESIIEWIETWRGHDPATPIASATATVSVWAASASLGPISAPAAPSVGVGDAAYVFAGRHDEILTQTVLSGDSLTWATRQQTDNTSGADAGVATQYGTNGTAGAVNVTAKTITATGTTDTGSGFMFIINVQPPQTLAGDVGADFTAGVSAAGAVVPGAQTVTGDVSLPVSAAVTSGAARVTGGAAQPVAVTAAVACAGQAVRGGAAAVAVTAAVAAEGTVPAASHIAYRAAAGSSGSGASATVTLPAGWAAGDLAAVSLTVHQAGQAPACAGWSIRYGDGDGYTWCTATRQLQAGDSGPVFTWAQACPWDAEAVALAPDTGYSLSVAAHPAEVSAGPGTQVTPPAAAAQAGDASLLLVAGRAAGAQVPATYGMTSPAGWLTAGAQEGSGGQPSAPYNVTSITQDAGAVVSFRPPLDQGGGAVTAYVVTPRIGGVPQTPATVPLASTSTVTGSDGNTYRRATVTGLANGTAYTFTVRARNAYGDSPESAASGENTPLQYLVFGDDFGGPEGGPVDPEWWIYDNRCGYLGQSEVAAYMASHCTLDGAGSLKLTAEHVNCTVPRYPSDPNYSQGTITQPWTSGACQGNTRLFYPAAGNTMTFEVRQQVCADAGSGFWPGLFWLNGQYYFQQWKTDPQDSDWNSTDKSEIDVAEWYLTGSPNSYGNVSWAGTNQQTNVSGSGLATSPHIYQALWKPGVNVVFKRDGTTTATHTSQVPASGAQMFLLLYLQMLAGGPTATESCYIDYVRVFDQNLG